jgi:hypothetical protein
VVARDSAGGEARAGRTVEIRKLAPDTQPLPAPLTGRELRPETVVVGFTTPWAVAIAVGAVAAPSVLGRIELRSARSGDAANLLVGGTVLGVGLVAFLTSHHRAFSPENARRNAETRRHHAEQVAEVEAANARARRRVGYWIWIDGSGP